MPHKILLVEDEESLLDIIKLNLELEGYEVTSVSNGKVALNEIRSNRFDLVILDVMLPEMDGFSICQAVRLDNNPVPILFLTAKNSSEDRVFGLKIGGDDYLSKPFNLEELLLRIQLLLKRNSGAITKHDDVLKFGDCEVNFITYEVKGHDGKKHQITKREILLLKLLAERKNEVVSREEILEKIWGEDVSTTTRTIDNYIVAFRKYFEENAKEPKYFHSIRGVGYRFTP
ncbi:MAG: Response regulator MprA [Bacteroidia bacterium]|nr:Response regulator MprA [Bacteroidia bacterium]